MREKLETLSLAQLHEFAKGVKLKGASTMKKAELIEALVRAYEAEEQKKQESGSGQETKTEQNAKPAKTNKKVVMADQSKAPVKQSTDNGSVKEERTKENQKDCGKDVATAEDYPAELDSGIKAHGILEVLADGYGFIRCANYMPGDNDVYVAPSWKRKYILQRYLLWFRVMWHQARFAALI